MTEIKHTVKEPLFHVVKREGLPLWKTLLVYGVAIVFGLLVVSVFCAICSEDVNNPIEMFTSMFSGAFGTERRIWLFLRNGAMLLGVSLALLPAFRMKFWNLGANGQIVISCLVCYALLIWGRDTGASNAVVVMLMIVLGVGAGVVWAVLPAVFKAFFGTNETLFTLMMNYIAQGLVTVMITVWAPTGSGSLSPIDDYGLPVIGNAYLLPIIVITLITVFMFFYLSRSKHGYELAVVGESEKTARYAGINVKAVTIRTLVLSGAVCGIVGVLLAGAVNHNVSTASHDNMGFTAIMTSYLAGFNPIVTIATSFLITFISVGMGQVRQDFGFYNDAIANVALGMVYFFIIACYFFINYKLVFKNSKKPDEIAFIVNNKKPADGGKEDKA
ncbi:MAG: ABC transporter permease [Clostridia bacterium]|nr:ABC transporter permease [Clostridia bacterium]